MFSVEGFAGSNIAQGFLVDNGIPSQGKSNGQQWKPSLH